MSTFEGLAISVHCHVRHYYVTIAMKPNGSMENVIDENFTQLESNRSRRLPVARPLIAPRSNENRYAKLYDCPIQNCISGAHGNYCDGSIPSWLFSLKINLLNPGTTFDQMPIIFLILLRH